MSLAPRIATHLQNTGVNYELIAHQPSHSSMQSAVLAHIPPKQLAKAVVTHDGDRYRLCVIPTDHRLMMDWLDEHMHGHFTLADEQELMTWFEDCVEGAVPALGQAYGMPVTWDDALAEAEDIYFECGDHQHLVHLKRGTFMELMGRQDHARISCPADDHLAWMIH